MCAEAASCLSAHAVCERCECHSARYLKEDSEPVRRTQICPATSDSPCRVAGWVCWESGEGGEGGELLDLSCLPFTHNVSFMNAACCADLIPFSTGLKKPYCAHSRAESARHRFQLILLSSPPPNATRDIWGGVRSTMTTPMPLEGITDDTLQLPPHPPLSNLHCIPHRREKQPCENLIAGRRRSKKR